MHVVQLAAGQWLVLDDYVQPRFLIVQGPMVNKETRETMVMHRVERWAIKNPREVLAVHDGHPTGRHSRTSAATRGATSSWPRRRGAVTSSSARHARAFEPLERALGGPLPAGPGEQGNPPHPPRRPGGVRFRAVEHLPARSSALDD